MLDKNRKKKEEKDEEKRREEEEKMKNERKYIGLSSIIFFYIIIHYFCKSKSHKKISSLYHNVVVVYVCVFFFLFLFIYINIGRWWLLSDAGWIIQWKKTVLILEKKTEKNNWDSVIMIDVFFTCYYLSFRRKITN